MTPHSTTVVRAAGLGKRLRGPEGELRILEGLDLEVMPGDAVSIRGASGSGKSTLLGLLAGLDEASDGEVFLFGHALSPLDEDERAALRAGQVGFVFQSFHLLAGMSALENVMLPLELGGVGDARERASALLERVGLMPRRHHLPSQLSGGEQQRVAIARAFATAPRVLFADEPTGNLDTVTGGRIADVLLELRAETGAALVLVTHDQQLADRCDRRLVLEDGRLGELG
ncbi:MAG: ATP-binding cassette domain-containing protein [Gammaproteobacteria bacterium]|jgi:putative ABC transport system ATP-binding protein|nr:ATP-binding cassette domain-containing protein [Gammaproteobacteria bacterium]